MHRALIVRASYRGDRPNVSNKERRDSPIQVAFDQSFERSLRSIVQNRGFGAVHRLLVDRLGHFAGHVRRIRDFFAADFAMRQFAIARHVHGVVADMLQESDDAEFEDQEKLKNGKRSVLPRKEFP